MAENIEKVKQYYDDHIVGKLRDFIHGNERIERAWNSLNEVIPQPPAKIFEIGCGVGHFALRMSEQWPRSVIMGFDISEKSIDTAELLFQKDNLSFIQRDDLSKVNIEKDILFDVICMIDVYEHISVEERTVIHQFVKDHLSPNGIFFISCPTPRFLKWLSIHAPDQIQPVDENIGLPEILSIQELTGRSLVYYKEISVWRMGDYFHAVFTNRYGLIKFNDRPKKVAVPSLKKQVINKVVKKIQEHKKNNPVHNEYLYKIEMIRKVFGDGMIEKLK